MKKKSQSCCNHILRDKDGIIYKYPNRTCKNCLRYPCFIGIENSTLDYAKYGCVKYKDE